MPSIALLTANPNLPDPFTKMDNSRITDKSEWRCRREEILRQGYEFIYGVKPKKPASITGMVSASTISEGVQHNVDDWIDWTVPSLTGDLDLSGDN